EKSHSEAGAASTVSEPDRVRIFDSLTPPTSLILARSVSAVTSVAQARQDETLFVEPFIDRGGPYGDVLVQAAHALEAFARGDQAYQTNVFGAAFLQAIDRGDGGVGGGNDGRYHDREALAEVGWGFEKIFHRREGLRLAIKADMGDARCRNQVHHAVDKGDAG